MADDIKSRVEGALLAMSFKPEDIHLETTASGSVGGHIVSGSFAGQTQMERQEHLWEGLRSNLKPDQIFKIVALLTVTPEEIEDE
ncbi:MAG: hypothetical protein EPO40_18275 [Myxococcaceae bacterium]|nr:MAG: hypothetical protein EPO40_18275 [Myxococcaceae bacterium]